MRSEYDSVVRLRAGLLLLLLAAALLPLLLLAAVLAVAALTTAGAAAAAAVAGGGALALPYKDTQIQQQQHDVHEVILQTCLGSVACN
jgi:hypothetical protein